MTIHRSRVAVGVQFTTTERRREMGKGMKILRCTGLALIVVGAMVLLPASALAQCEPGNHGVSIFKSCVSPKNRCGTDADCSDADACNGIEQCATEDESMFGSFPPAESRRDRRGAISCAEGSRYRPGEQSVQLMAERAASGRDPSASRCRVCARTYGPVET